jgi:hypothetical protein
MSQDLVCARCGLPQYMTLGGHQAECLSEWIPREQLEQRIASLQPKRDTRAPHEHQIQQFTDTCLICGYNPNLSDSQQSAGAYLGPPKQTRTLQDPLHQREGERRVAAFEVRIYATPVPGMPEAIATNYRAVVRGLETGTTAEATSPVGSWALLRALKAGAVILTSDLD